MAFSEKKSHLFAGIILLIFSLIALYLGYLVFSGVFIPLLLAILFAVVFYPVYNWLLQKTKSEIWSSLLTSLMLIAIIAAFVSFVIYLAVGEVVNIARLFTRSIDIQSMTFLTDQEQLEGLVQETIHSLDTFVQQIPFVDTSITAVLGQLLENIPPLIQEISSYIISIIRVGFDGAARGLVGLLIFFISFFFLLMDGNRFKKYAFKLLPINALHERQISKRFSSLCYAWIVVSLLLAFIQGSMSAIGFAIISVPSPLIWGIVSMLTAFIPFVGAGIIWGSIAIIYLIIGEWGSALFIVIWGSLLVSSVDNLLRPFLLKQGVKIHPLILFLAVLGGFFAFGVSGLIIGPLVIVFISTLLYIYELEFGEVLLDFHNHKDPKIKQEKE